MANKVNKIYFTVDPASPGEDYTCICKTIVNIKTGKIIKRTFKKLKKGDQK